MTKRQAPPSPPRGAPSIEAVGRYLSLLHGAFVEVSALERIGQGDGDDPKGYGYGKPLLVRYQVKGEDRRAVVATVSPGSFSHEQMSDRAQLLLWNHASYNELPRHVRSLDVGGFRRSGEMVSLGDVEEMFQLVEFADGAPYADDLIRMLATGDELTALDLARCDALADYLAQIHRRRGPTESTLYARHVRELVGHGECIMGLADSYPERHDDMEFRPRLERIEKACVHWRWMIRDRGHRLRQRHGDFHPWNLLFPAGSSAPVILDRSRGVWGDPADDVVCLGLNYLFFSLQRHGRLAGGFGDLFRRWFDRYLRATGDYELLEVAAPYVAFRALVMASPVWYPRLDGAVRAALFAFVERVLDAPRLDLDRVDELCRP